MDITKANISKLRMAMKNALAEVSKEYGVEIQFGNVTYSTSEINFKMNVLNGSKEEARKVKFKEICHMYGLKEDDYEKEFEFDGKQYKVMGINSRKRKNPIILIDSKGKEYEATLDFIKKVIG